ncbi:hypothetical protein ACFXKG_39900 [Streptomyces sp. NPDC059255]|uniref:hypothetical protein n=1 Tax=Streptomyces sp. NPDC059255 TaxID=3346793 RepID=UPI0036A87E72
MTAIRAVWFITAFVIAVPVMMVVFREDGDFTRAGFSKSLIFGAAIGVVATIAAGRGRQ